MLLSNPRSKVSLAFGFRYPYERFSNFQISKFPLCQSLKASVFKLSLPSKRSNHRTSTFLLPPERQKHVNILILRERETLTFQISHWKL